MRLPTEVELVTGWTVPGRIELSSEASVGGFAAEPEEAVGGTAMGYRMTVPLGLM